MSEGGFDPVEDFFAREREAVVPTEVTTGTGRASCATPGRGSRARTRGYLTGAAAAAVVVARGRVGRHHRRARRPVGPHRSRRRSTTAAPVPPARGPPVPSAAPPAVTRGVPASFRARSLTNVGGGHLYALGNAGLRQPDLSHARRVA